MKIIIKEEENKTTKYIALTVKEATNLIASLALQLHDGNGGGILYQPLIDMDNKCEIYIVQSLK